MIGIIIVSWGRHELLEKTLFSLFANSHDTPNVCLIDNGSNPETIEVIEKYKHRFAHCCLLAQNEGKPHAWNYGAKFFDKHDEIDYLLFCDSDLFFYPDWDVDMLKTYKAFEEKSINNLQLGSLSGFKFSDQGKHYDCQGEKLIVYPYPAGCCMLMKKSIYNKVGEFKEDRLIFQVDVKYYKRMRRKQLYASSMFPDSAIEHTGVKQRTFCQETGKESYLR